MKRSIMALCVASVIGFGVTVMQPCFAWGLLDAIDTSKPASDDLYGNLHKLNARFSVAMQEMLKAQSYTMRALHDQEMSDRLESAAKSLEGTNDIDVVARSVQISQDAAIEIDEKMKTSGALDANSKDMLIKAVPHYAIGIVAAIRLPVDYNDWIQAARKSVTSGDTFSAVLGGITIATQLDNVVTVTQHLPDLVSTWVTASGNFVKYAKGNGVDTGDLASKI